MSKKNVEREWKKLGDVCEVIAGQSPKGSSYNNNEEGMEFHQGKKSFGKTIIESSGVWTSEITKIASPEDILISVRAPVGPVNFTDRQLCIGRGLAAIRAKRIDKKYLYLFLVYNESNMTSKTGAVFDSISRNDIINFEIPIPPLDEQERIVKVLDDAFEKIDTIKTTAETNLQNAKDLFQTTLANELSITDEKIKQGWEEKTLDDCCEITSVLVDPKEKKYRKLLHIGGANIESETGRLLDLQTAEEENLISGKFLFDDTMILYSKIRPYLKKIVQPDFSGLCSADIYPLSVKRNMNKGFLFYTLFSEPFTDFANKNSARAGMPKINRESLFAYKFFLPPLPIQKQIVAKLDSLSEKVKQLEFNYKQVLTNCDELKKALLKQAFEGML